MTGLRTILAAGRSDRPFDVSPQSSVLSSQGEKPERECPFCEGHEAETPPEVWADRPAGETDSSGWRVRAVPNLYPALSGEDSAPATDDAFASSADPLRAGARGSEPDLFAETPARGAHEVIVHSPRHVTSLAELDDGELAIVVSAWRERIRAHEAAACCQLIVNEGREAGASLEHSHAQLYALDFVPPGIARERERAGAYHERTMGGRLLSDIASEEVRRGERLVAIDDEAILICPWASHSPFEMRLLPRASEPRFEAGDGGAPMLGTALRALRTRFGSPPPLNLWVRTAPRGVEEFHWHIDIAPKLSVRAGFELSTGVEINIQPPERAAAELRESLA